MVRRFGVDLIEITDRGHAPDLPEPDARAALAAFLERPAVLARWR